MCRLCEHVVFSSDLKAHTHHCKIVSQCNSLTASCDETLSRLLLRLNAVSNTSAIFGSSSSQVAQLLELLRAFTMVMFSITAHSHSLPLLSAMPPKLDELVAASRVQPTTASIWTDVKAASTRKLVALQHGSQWSSELQHTIVQQPHADPLTLGQPPRLSDFEMVREIQRGSHAAVWLVKKKQTQDEFAMKIIDKNKGRIHRLRTEKKVLFSCGSPFVVSVFYAFEDERRLHLVMECLSSDCKQLLLQRGILTEPQVVSIMADVTLGLEHLHACGIIHRDIKPENMLLTSTGRVKLADFGLSQLKVRDCIRDDDVNKDPSIVGTPFYMAPETIRGKTLGQEASADWWSYGAVMYELLTGFTPFQGSKITEIYRAVLSGTFACPPSRCSISRDAADLISRLLVPNPRNRLKGAPTVMSHSFFSSINWSIHSMDTTGQARSNNKVPLQAGVEEPTHQKLANIGRAILQRAWPAASDPTARHDSNQSDSLIPLRSVTSTEQSAASTHIGEQFSSGLPLMPQDPDTHLDNLKVLNERLADHHKEDLPNLLPNVDTK